MDYNNKDFINFCKRAAWDEFKQLKSIIEGMTFDKTYNMLHGYNLENQQDNKQFDVNFACITATVYEYNGHCVLNPIIDFWDNVISSPILECYDILTDHEFIWD